MDILYSTDDLARMFRVGKSTIKRWTDEGKLQCFKTPGGHRKFKPSNVHSFINQYHYEIVGPLLPFARTGETISADSITVGAELPVEECYQGAIKGKRGTVEGAFTLLAARGMSPAAMFDGLLTPVLRMVHQRFAQQQITPVEFMIAKNTLIHSLIHVADQLPKADRKDVELYCLSVNEGMNEVELKAVELLLESMGLTVYNLGTVLTRQAAESIVQQCKPEDVFVVLSLDHPAEGIVGQFNELVQGVRAYGGNVYTSNFFEENAGHETVSADAVAMHSFTEIAERLIATVHYSTGSRNRQDRKEQMSL